MNRLLSILFISILAFSGVIVGCSNDQTFSNSTKEVREFFVLATTTSTMDSGLLDVLIPIFEEETGYMVKPVAVGTGKALAMGEEGEADALLVHAPASERPLVDKGIVINYQLVMHNDFVVVGPKADPASVGEAKSVSDAFANIKTSNSLFISRGDDSGTNKKELQIWENANIEYKGNENYQETGQGMGGTLRVASEKDAYTLTDRATYLALKHELHLDILFEGDEMLHNIYHVMQVNPEKFDSVKVEPAKAFVEFMIKEETQKIIADFGKEKYGQPLFFPDALE